MCSFSFLPFFGDINDCFEHILYNLNCVDIGGEPMETPRDSLDVVPGGLKKWALSQ